MSDLLPVSGLDWGVLKTKYYIQGIDEKGSGNVVPAVCVQRDRYIVDIVEQTAETTSPEPFS